MASYLTENDILKSLVRRGALTDLCKELNTQILSSPRDTSTKKEEVQQRD